MVEYQRAPVRMGSLSRITCSYTGAVKLSESEGIPGEMGRYPVEDHADALVCI